MPHGMESPAATRAFPGRGLLIALVALLPLTLAWGPNLNIPPTMIVTGAGLDTAYSSPASDSLEGEWLLGIRAFSTRIHFDDPVQLVWYGATAEIMRGFSSENYRFGAAIQGGWAVVGVEAGFFTWLDRPTTQSGVHAGLGLTVGFVTLHVRQTLSVHGTPHFTQFGLRLNAPLHAHR